MLRAVPLLTLGTSLEITLIASAALSELLEATMTNQEQELGALTHQRKIIAPSGGLCLIRQQPDFSTPLVDPPIGLLKIVASKIPEPGLDISFW